jgi:hypothetical protein
VKSIVLPKTKGWLIAAETELELLIDDKPLRCCDPFVLPEVSQSQQVEAED